MNRRWFVRALLVGLAAVVPGALGAQGARLYVTNQDEATVSVVDLASHRVVETVDLRKMGFGANAKPHHAQVEPDGSHWYLTMIGEGKVLKLDRTNRIVGTVETEVPGLMTIVPGTDLLFVGRSMSAVNPPPRLVVIRRSDFTVVDEVDVFFPRPHALIAHPSGQHVYVASLGVNQLARVGVAELDVELVDVPGPPHSFTQAAVSPDGRWLALTAELTDQVLIFDLADAAHPALARRIAMPDGPFEPIFTPDGRFLYVTALTADRVAVVAAETWMPIDTIAHEGFAQPHGVGVSPDGQYVYVSNRHQHGGAHDHEGMKPTGRGTLAVICAATHEVEKVLTIGAYGAGIGVPAPASVPLPPSTPCR